MKSEENELREISNSYLIKPITKTDLIKHLKIFLPYKQDIKISSKIQNTEKQSDDFNLDNLDKYPKVLEYLKTKTEYINQLIVQMTINDIIDFAVEIEDVSQKYNCKDLTNWSREIHKLTENFDTDGVKMMFDILISRIQ